MELVGFFPFMTGTVFAQSDIHRCPRTFEMPEDKMFALWLLLQKGCIFPRSWVSLPAWCGYSRYAWVPQILQVTQFWAVESVSRSFLPINGSFDNSWKPECGQSWELATLQCFNLLQVLDFPLGLGPKECRSCCPRIPKPDWWCSSKKKNKNNKPTQANMSPVV